MKAERISYNGWNNVWKLTTEQIELRVTADVGPRILQFGFLGEEGEFHEAASDAGLTGGNEFRPYGGHRFWIAPENDRTIFPDNRPVEVVPSEHDVRFKAPPEDSGLQKELVISADANRVRVLHRVTNHAREATELAPWALSVLKPGGKVILPLPPIAPHGKQHLLPTTTLALWSYTDLNAPCWRIGPQYIEFNQTLADGVGFGMQKVGMRNDEGWGAHFREGHLFLKHAKRIAGTYPDIGCNFETFANPEFIELETLGPLATLSPATTVEHLETWLLIGNVPSGEGDEWVERVVRPHAKTLVA